jgi:predicted RNA-binding protein associated with RNAse of E/G family
MKEIKLRFVRLPDDIATWTHELLHQDESVIISKFRFSGLKRPSEIKGRVVVDNEYMGICYEFVDKGYEIIKVFDLDERLTGYYCNINTRPRLFEGGYEVVDLFLDVWVFPDLEYSVMDEDEFECALEKGLIGEKERAFAQTVLRGIIGDLEEGKFPPRIVDEIG